MADRTDAGLAIPADFVKFFADRFRKMLSKTRNAVHKSLIKDRTRPASHIIGIDLPDRFHDSRHAKHVHVRKSHRSPILGLRTADRDKGDIVLPEKPRIQRLFSFFFALFLFHGRRREVMRRAETAEEIHELSRRRDRINRRDKDDAVRIEHFLFERKIIVVQDAADLPAKIPRA